VGTGDSDESAAADAASQWAMGVLPVIVSYMLRSHVCEVEKLPMIVGVEDSQERYGWNNLSQKLFLKNCNDAMSRKIQ